MKKLLVAAIAAAAFFSAPALAEPPALFNWTGFYIGVNGGGMSDKTDGTFQTPGFNSNTDRQTSGIAGIHGGFQGQWGNLVAGVEGSFDLNLNDGYGSHDGSGVTGTPCGLNVGFACQARINDILQVGPRVGFAMNQWMAYGTVGYARAMIESRDIVGTNVFDTGANHHHGWYAGGGLEFLVTNGFIVGVEYKHFDFSSEQYNCCVLGDKRIVNAKADAVLLRLTIK